MTPQLQNRLERIKDELAQLVYRNVEPVTDIRARYGKLDRAGDAPWIRDGFVPFPNGGVWAEAFSQTYCLFSLEVAVSPGQEGRPLVLEIRTNRSGWNAVNPQMLAFVDGEPFQGLDTNHTQLKLSDRAEPGQRFRVLLYAFSGLDRNNVYPNDQDSPVTLSASLMTRDPEVWAAYYDFKNPLPYLAALDPEDIDTQELLLTLNRAANALDLRQPYSPAFYRGLAAAREILQGLATRRRGHATLLPHTHIDVAWLWRFAHTRDKAVRSFATAVRLAREYPNFSFFSSQPQLYQYVKEDCPALYAQIQDLVRAGRWEVDGGMWLEADMNLTSGESLVRQLLYGKRFIRQEFGVDSQIGWFPDMFGFNAALPQILRQAGVRYFMTSKLYNNEFNRFPHDTFLWRGIDGTEILAQLLNYAPVCYISDPERSDVLEAFRQYRDKDVNDDILLSIGFGDGGGGPTPGMIECANRMEQGLPGVPSAALGRAEDYFRRLEQRQAEQGDFPRFVGELYYEKHRGTYTSVAKNKRNNRLAERLLANAEWLREAERLLLDAQPEGDLRQPILDMLLCQFHDVLPGTAIAPVYEDTDRLYASLHGAFAASIRASLARLGAALPCEGPGLAVWNPLGHAQDQLVSFPFPEPLEALMGPDGERYPCQRTAQGAYLAFVRNVPAKGYRVLRAAAGDGAAPRVRATATGLESPFLRLTLAKNGDIASLFDKRAGREVFQPGRCGNALVAYEDKPRCEDNWNLDVFYTEKAWPLDAPCQTRVLEQGPVRAVVEVQRRFMDSTIRQRIAVYADLPCVDLETEIDWRQQDIALKAHFPVDVNADHATYEIQFGHLDRPTHRNTSWEQAKFEVCGHKWALIGDNGYGLALINDCKYGHSALDSTLSLTLLRSGRVPYEAADKHRHAFTYRLQPTAGNRVERAVIDSAYALNNPLLAQPLTEARRGQLPPQLSLVTCEGAVLETVKRAEDGEATVLRLYEATNATQNVILTFPRPLAAAALCNLLEEDEDAARLMVEGRTCRFRIKPFELVTLKVSLG